VRSTNPHCCAHLALPMKTNNYHQAHLMLPMKTHAHAHAHAHAHTQPQVTHLMSPRIRRKRRGVLAWKCKGVDISGAEQMRALLLMPLARGARKPSCKSTVQVSPCSIQIRIAVQQGRLLKSELHHCMQRAPTWGYGWLQYDPCKDHISSSSPFMSDSVSCTP